MKHSITFGGRIYLSRGANLSVTAVLSTIEISAILNRSTLVNFVEVTSAILSRSTFGVEAEFKL